MMIAAYGLSKHFPVRGAFRARTTLKAVDDAQIRIGQDEIVGLVGESGSGKSTLGRCLIRLLEPTKGEVLFNIPDDKLVEYERIRATVDPRGASPAEARQAAESKLEALAEPYSLLARSQVDMRRLRRNMNIVFQDPYSSLNPRLRLADIISEPMLSTRFCSRDEAAQRSQDLLREVGLPEFFEDRYPHELSGGQRQRVAIARAISTNPKLLILDEPTSALDVSVQAQILNMLRDLRTKHGISMLLITHNIAVVAYLAERVYVMYAGKVMEVGDKARVLKSPDHPYTRALMSAVPIAGERRTRILLRGDPPNLVAPPRACRFHPRCPAAFEPCGWTADEVAEDLRYLLMGKHFATFGDALSIETPDDATVVVGGAPDVAQVREVVAREAEDIRSLKAVRSVTSRTDAEGGGEKVVIALHDVVDPEMYLTPDGKLVKCLLFRPNGGSVESTSATGTRPDAGS